MAGFMRYLLGNNTPIDVTFANGFVVKMNHELHQIYWQWQRQGRPSSVVYVQKRYGFNTEAKNGDENTDATFSVQLNKTGRPILGDGKLTQHACAEFIGIFVEQELLNNGWKVSTTYLKSSKNTVVGIEHEYEISDTSYTENRARNDVAVCKYEVLNRTFVYVPEMAKFKEL
ncbi:hypothetical protein GCM10007852_31460 [Agaribacter marinus]|uniref:Uncharacterized protein n=2 Tax=Agaribacter marinus TaxID=1431249 RepID=A0AA37SYY9_9ALTE|nr:hypothetical protein GCM10007852_31460 [Agaribacter marinus]